MNWKTYLWDGVVIVVLEWQERRASHRRTEQRGLGLSTMCYDMLDDGASTYANIRHTQGNEVLETTNPPIRPISLPWRGHHQRTQSTILVSTSYGPCHTPTHMLLDPLQCEVLINWARNFSKLVDRTRERHSRRPAFKVPFARTSEPGRKPNTPSLY